MFFTIDFADKLKETFRSNDSDAHALSLDMFWELLKLQSLKSHLCSNSAHCSECVQVDQILCKWVEQYCSGEKFSSNVKESLLALMIDSVWSPIKAIPFNQKVIRPGLWKSLFSSLQASSVSLRHETFKDFNALLLNRPDNATDLASFENWQMLIIPYLFPCFDEFQKNTALAMNIMSTIHLHCFLNWKTFIDQLCRTLHLIRQQEMEQLKISFWNQSSEEKVSKSKYPLVRSESISTARTFLESICSKLEEKATSIFGITPEHTSLAWNNLIHLCHVISLFIFNTPKWNHLLLQDYDTSSSLDWHDLLKASNQSALMKFRLHRVSTADGSLSWSQDLILLQKMHRLLNSAKLSKLDIESEVKEGISAKQKDFLIECKKWHDFYKDAVQFVMFIREFEPIFSWTKDQMYSLCKEFMTKESSKRPDWISKLCLKQHNRSN
jgi:hypothetical protein